MKKISLIAFVSILVFSLSGMAQQMNYKEFTNQEYWEVVSGRAAKIVESMDLKDAAKEKQVQDLIAAQYYRLNGIHDTTDEKIEELKKSDLEKAKKEKEIEKLNAKREKDLAKLHKSYLKDLSKELTAEQIDEVKNGMTYSVLVHTWDGYLDMLPDLTKDQKTYIWNALVEAREKAMDAGSSKAKHAWFGKYKGRINNYLSKEGYDLNKASEEWHERLREKGIEL
ncbi:DUF3826 domain-containing protein [Mangrovibacterium lignilyticum]|uniref:DUF3826 domain-containing protein n=1 Tax=Mangrovibacterium lignilyticum TaxID=2668052 RepID=UPI001966FA3D|nr:DUF3826 domain-containing protein [Mangrovibacterium lignilyticum]